MPRACHMAGCRYPDESCHSLVTASWAAHQLVCQHEHSLQTELSVAEVEEVLQAGAKEIDDHHVVVALDAEPADVRDARCSARVLSTDKGLYGSCAAREVQAGAASEHQWTHLRPAGACRALTHTEAVDVWTSRFPAQRAGLSQTARLAAAFKPSWQNASSAHQLDANLLSRLYVDT